MRDSKPRNLALAGLMTALAIVIQQIGAITQIGSYTAAVFSGLILIPVMDLGKRRYSIGTFFAVLFLSIFLVTDKEIPLMWFLICSSPIIRDFFRKRIENQTFQLILTYLTFLILSIFTYPIILRIFLLEDLAQEAGLSGSLITVGFFGTTSLIFFLYQLLYKLSEQKWRKLSKNLPKG